MKELSTDTPNKSSFNKPLPQTSFHWLNRGRVGIYSPVPVPWRWPPCLSAPPPNPMLSCKQQQPAWSFLCVSPSWVGSIFEESRNNKAKYRQNPEALQFLRAYLFFLHVTNYTFHAVFGEMNHFFYLPTFHKSDNSLKYQTPLKRFPPSVDETALQNPNEVLKQHEPLLPKTAPPSLLPNNVFTSICSDSFAIWLSPWKHLHAGLLTTQQQWWSATAALLTDSGSFSELHTQSFGEWGQVRHAPSLAFSLWLPSMFGLITKHWCADIWRRLYWEHLGSEILSVDLVWFATQANKDQLTTVNSSRATGLMFSTFYVFWRPDRPQICPGGHTKLIFHLTSQVKWRHVKRTSTSI